MDNLATRVAPGSPKHILVLDDNEMLLKFWDRLLGHRHLNCSHYTVTMNATAALHAMQEVRFDLAIIDIVMPQMDGFDFVRRAWQYNPAMQLVFTTGYECDFAHIPLENDQPEQRDVHVLLKPYQDINRIEEFIGRLSDGDPSLNETDPVYNESNLRFHLWKL